MSALAFEDLSLGYGRFPAVHRLEVEIKDGSLTAVVGPNGAGKSTLLKGITGALSPLGGRVSFGSLSPQDIAYLPQQSDIDRSFPMSVLDLVSMGLWSQVGPFGALRRSHRKRVQEAIDAVGLTGLERQAIGTLSGGQMQRGLFARLLLQDAKLILLDEPFSAIDTQTMADLIEVIRDWHRAGRTVLAVLHDHDTVRAHFPETLMLARELVAHGPTQQVMTSENHSQALALCEACERERRNQEKSAA